jgi:hypothetical protein
MWIKLEEGLFYLGKGGVNRMQPYSGYNVQQEAITGTELYIGTTKVGTTKTSIERIHELLNEHLGDA